MSKSKRRDGMSDRSKLLVVAKEFEENAARTGHGDFGVLSNQGFMKIKHWCKSKWTSSPLLCSTVKSGNDMSGAPYPRMALGNIGRSKAPEVNRRISNCTFPIITPLEIHGTFSRHIQLNAEQKALVQILGGTVAIAEIAWSGEF